MCNRLLLVLIVSALGCGEAQQNPKKNKGDAVTTADGLGFVTPETGPEPDTEPVTGEDTPPIDVPPAPSALTVFLNEESFSGDTYDLPALLPGPGVQVRIKVQIANFGQSDLTITAVGLEATNQDATPKNVWVTLDYGTFDPSAGFPLVLKSHDVDLSSILELDIVYKPESFDDNDATLLVTSTDPTVPAHRIRFASPPIAPKIRIDPPSATFSTADLLNAEEKTFLIHNDGIAPLSLSKIELAPSTAAGYTLSSTPEWGGQVKPKGSEGYEPLSFAVRFQPVFGASKAAGTVVVTTNDAPAEVALSSTFDTDAGASPCVFAWEGKDKGVLDFSDTTVGPKTLAVTLKNFGDGACTVSYVAVPEDPTGAAYEVAITIPGDPPIVVDTLPSAVGPGKEMRFDVTYTAGLQSLDATLVIDYQDPFPKQLSIPALGGGPKPCFDFAPGTAVTPLALQMVAAPGDYANRTFMIYSCGDAPLSITGVTIEDAGTAGQPSTLFSLVQPAPSLTIPPGGTQAYLLQMSPAESFASKSAAMTIHYGSLTGPKSLSVTLNGTAMAGIVLPTANAGSSSDYQGVLAGQQVLLDGSKSTSGGDLLDENGYVWFLVTRPLESKKTLNGPPGPAQRSFVPDVAGAYTFALVVKTKGTVPYTSAESIVTVYVGAAP